MVPGLDSCTPALTRPPRPQRGWQRTTSAHSHSLDAPLCVARDARPQTCGNAVVIHPAGDVAGGCVRVPVGDGIALRDQAHLCSRARAASDVSLSLRAVAAAARLKGPPCPPPTRAAAASAVAQVGSSLPGRRGAILAVEAPRTLTVGLRAALLPLGHMAYRQQHQGGECAARRSAPALARAQRHDERSTTSSLPLWLCVAPVLPHTDGAWSGACSEEAVPSRMPIPSAPCACGFVICRACGNACQGHGVAGSGGPAAPLAAPSDHLGRPLQPLLPLRPAHHAETPG